MRNLLLIIMSVFAAVSFGAYTEDFESFPIEMPLENPPAANNWELFPDVGTVNTTTIGEYVGSIAIRKSNTSWVDTQMRITEDGVDFNLALDGEAIEYGFDWCEGSTTAFNAKMWLRNGATATYFPSFGINSGVVRLRPYGEYSATGEVTGVSFANSSYHTVYWQRGYDGGYGSWLRFRLRLSGPDFNIATVYCYNLTTGEEMPTGIVDYDTGRNMRAIAGDMNRFYIRTHSLSSWLDNVYVKDVYPEGVVASYPSPASGSTNVSISNTVLSWSGYPGATAQRVYFGTTAELDDPADYKGEQTEETFIPGNLDVNTTYYWRVDQVYNSNVYEGDVWSFTTHGNLMAYEPFDYTTGSLGNSAGGGFGWNGTWQRLIGGWCYVTVSSGSIEPDFFYSNGYFGNKVDFDNSAVADNNDGKRELTIPINLDEDKVYYLSYLASADNELENQLNFELFDEITSDPWLSLGMLYEGYPNVTSPMFRLRDPAGNWVENLFGSWQSNMPNLVVLKIVTSGSGNDMVYASVYNSSKVIPSNEPEQWDASFEYDGSGLLSWIGFDGRASDEYGNFQIDEIRYGLSWQVTAGEAAIEHPRLIAYEGFEYTPFLSLSQGGNGAGGSGWADDWERVEGGWCYVMVGDGSLNPTTDYLLGTKGNKVQHVAGGVHQGGMRKLEYPIDTRIDRDYYISYLAMGESNTYNQVTLGLYEEKAGNFLFRTHQFYEGFPNVDTPKFALRDDSNIWTTRQFGSWASGEVYLYVIKISATSGGDDTVSVSVYNQTKPLPTEEPTEWDASFTTQTNSVYPWIEISGRADQYDTWNIDEIYIGTGWGAVTGWATACGDIGTIMPYDFNEDCQINMVDFGIMADDWLRCTDPLGDDCQWAIAPNDPNFAGLFTSLDSAETNVYQTSSITLDGDLSEWEGSRWYNAKFTSGYNTANITDVTEAKISLKWISNNPDVVYLGVKVADNSQSFSAAPIDWNSGENIEVKFTVNDNSTDTNWYDSELFDTAQRYSVYLLSGGGVYTNLGNMDSPKDASEYTDIECAVTSDGSYIYYEIAIPAYSTYNVATKSGTKASLSDGDVIAFNIQFNSVNGDLSGALFNNQSHNPQDWSKFTVVANSSMQLGDMGFFATDLDNDGYVNSEDMDVIIGWWLSCTDPEIDGCIESWLP